MHLEPEQEALLARMIEGGREVARSEREWLLMSYGRGSFFQGPGVTGREDGVEGDVRILERAGLIEPIRFSKRDGNPTYVLTPEAHEHYRATRKNAPFERQEAELRRFLDSD